MNIKTGNYPQLSILTKTIILSLCGNILENPWLGQWSKFNYETAEVRLKAVTIVTLLIASSNNPQWSLCLLSQRGISEFLNLGHELIYTANNATYFLIYT